MNIRLQNVSCLPLHPLLHRNAFFSQHPLVLHKPARTIVRTQGKRRKRETEKIKKIVERVLKNAPSEVIHGAHTQTQTHIKNQISTRTYTPNKTIETDKIK